MSKIKKTLLDDSKLDNDLNFDDFLLDDIDSEISPSAKDKKSRSPVIDVYKGTIGGLKDKFTDPSFLAKVAKDSLPPQYSQTISVVDDAIYSASSLYDEAIRDIKPQLSRLAKKVDKLVPNERKFFKALTTKFKDLAGDESNSFRSQSNTELNDTAIANSLSSIFAAQTEANNEVQARKAAEDKITQSIEGKRFQYNFGLLTGINTAVVKLADYNDKVNIAYQKKSLELQFRSYFVQSELLKASNRFFEVSKNQNEAIVKNTALPEFVKINTSEKFRDVARTKFMNSIQSSLFGDNDFIKKGIANFKNQTKQTLEGVKSGLEGALSGIDSLESLREQNEMLKEMGGEEISKYQLLGTMLGSGVGDAIGGFTSKHIKSKIKDDSKLGRLVYKLGTTASNVKGSIKAARDSDFIRDNYFETGAKGAASKTASWFLDLFGSGAPDKTFMSNTGLRGMDTATVFNNKTQQSITEIIPGYLARIHREIIVSRTKNEGTPLTTFDFNKGSFTTSTQLASDIRKSISDKFKTNGLPYATKTAREFLFNTENNDSDTNSALDKFLTDLSTENMDYTAENIKNSKAYTTASPDTVSLIDTFLKEKFEESKNKEKSKYEFTTSIGNIKNATPDIRREIELLMKAGYSDILESEGLIERNKFDGYDLNMETYKKMAAESTVVTSDINAKRNISSFKPKDALAAIKKTKIYNWAYKTGMGDQIPHVGPMAQDVKTNIGEEAAPNGTSIDLTTMNGLNMSAIDALREGQEKLLNNDDSSTYLKEIKKDTAIIVDILKEKASIGSSEGGFKLTSLIGGIFGAVGKVGGTLSDMGKPINDFLKNAIKDNKGKVTEIFTSMLSKAGQLASKVMEVGTDLLYNKLPAGFKQIAAIGNKFKNEILNILDGPIDIYRKGFKTPLLRANLMRMGFYLDQATGKVIKNVKDITGPVVNRLNEVVMTVEDIDAGLVDSNGRDIVSTFTKLAKMAIGAGIKGFNRIKNFTGNVLDSLGGKPGSIVDKVKGIFKTIGSSLGNDKVYDVLVEIRDILRSTYGTPTNQSNPVNESVETTENTTPDNSATVSTEPRYIAGGGIGSILNFGKKAVTSIGSGIAAAKAAKGIKGKLRAFGGGLFKGKDSESESDADKTKENEPIYKGPEVNASTKTTTTHRRSFSGQPTWNDRDSSGKRDGAWQDRLELQEERKKNKVSNVAQADLNPRYKSNTNVLDTIFDKASSLFGLLSGGIGGIFSKATGIFDAVGGALGLSGVGGMLGKVGKGALNLIKNPGTILTGVTKAASTIKGLASTATLGRAAMVAGTVARGALAVGGVAATTAGSMLYGVLGATISAIAGVFASPVVLGAAAVAAVAVGGYYTYKYFTRNKINEYEKIRMMQYGLTGSDSDKSHNHELLELERYLTDGKIGYNTGSAYILEKAIDVEDMLSIFSIDKGDSEQFDRFDSWLQYRFKPFFLTHLTALYSINNKAKLDEVDGLTIEERLRYLGLVSFESGPYNEVVSPFKDIESLSSDKRYALNTIENLTKDLKSKLDSKVGKVSPPMVVKEKTLSDLAKLSNKKEEPIKIPETKIPDTKNVWKGVIANPNMQSNGEEGKMNDQPKSDTSSTITAGTGKVSLDDGPVKDGANGMQYVNLQSGATLDGLNPSLLDNFKAMAEDYGEKTGNKITVNSGYRSTAQQSALYKKDPSLAAKPGRSLHEFGLALDINSKDLNELDSLGLMRKYGFTRPVGGEPWHTEAAGIQGNLDEAKSNSNFASQAIEASLLKGGGGLGSISGSTKGKRDPKYAMQLFESSSTLVASDKDKATEMLTPSKTTSIVSNEPGTITNNDTGVTEGVSGPTTPVTYNQQPATNDDNYAKSVTSGGGYAGSVDAAKGSNQSNGDASNYSLTDNLPDSEKAPYMKDTTDTSKIDPKNKEQIKDVVAKLAKKTGTDPNLMTAFAAVESGLNPNAGAKTSNAKGLFQFLPGTWREQMAKNGSKYGLDPSTGPTDVTASTLLAADYIKSNLKVIKPVKPDTTPTDVYLTHFLGPYGAKKFLSANSNEKAASVLPKAAGANRGIFYKDETPLTISSVYDLLTSRIAKAAKSFGIGVPSSSLSNKGLKDNEDSNETSPTPLAGSTIPNATTAKKEVANSPTPTTASSADTGGMQMPGSGPSSKVETNDYQQPSITSVSSSTKPTDAGPGFSMDSLSSGIGNIDVTLSKSLSVQEQILQALQQLVSNGGSGNQGPANDGLMNVVDKVGSAAKLPQEAIDLSRKIA
jgi:hypothetical protein